MRNAGQAHSTGSQARALMAEKERLARELLAQGLTVTQICQQLRCSSAFVRKARDRMAQDVPTPVE